MKKTVALTVLTLGLVLSSCGNSNPPEHKPDHLDLSGTYQTEFVVGTEFNHIGLTVNLVYDDNVSVPVSDFRVSHPNMEVLGPQDVMVEYITISTTYQITVVAATLTGISLSGTYQTEFTVGDTFSHTGLVVTASYNNERSALISDYQVSSPDMSILGEQEVTVTYGGFEQKYTINIEDVQSTFPLNRVSSFLSTRGVNNPSSYLSSKILEIESVISYQVVENDDCPYFEVVYDMEESYADEILMQLLEAGWENFDSETLMDPGHNIALKSFYKNDGCHIELYAYSDLVVVPPEEEEGENKVIDFPLQNAGYIAKETNLSGKSYTFSDFTFAFTRNGSSNDPASVKSNYVALYTDNTLTISSKYKIYKIEFSDNKDKNGDLSTSGVLLTKVNDLTTWEGEGKSITFTALAQYRFNNVKIYYFEHVEPVITGEKTIKEVLEFAKTIEYTPTNGWYLTNNEVTIKVKAIDAIDSVTTSGLDANARGKVLCVDETGYIVCSSGVSKNNPIDFYQRVKDYIKSGETTYAVNGKIAFFNDVVEIKVDSYRYLSDLEIDYDLNHYVTSGVTDSDSFMNHCKEIKTNNDGYGLGKIVKLNALTYFNKYNSAGSYYFLDQEGKLIPVYSLLDKDRSSMQEGKVYDIIGVESLYKGRPSLRILKVTSNLGADPSSFDFSNAVEKETTKYFYNVNSEHTSYQDEFYNSVTTIYKMDVYVSRYAADKYTFNESYYKINKEYTTGNSQVSAAQHYSLGVFNEDLDYKQIFIDFVLENATSEEECVGLTLYFTLAYLDTVDGKEMWRVNVFEDLVFGLDYYESDSKSIDFTSMTPTHDDTKQVYQSGNLKVTNASTSLNNYSYSTYYLKVVDGTSLKIEFNEPIMAFTIYHKTYSYIAGVGELEIASYRQFNDYTVFLLSNPTTSIFIDDFAVGASRTNAYLGIESITVNY